MAICQHLEELKATGAHCDEELRAQFPLFEGHAPPGHPYPEAWRLGAESAQNYNEMD